ncbi:MULTISPECIES: YacL family protein [unclassified Pseudoalteromonas]|uniref:YacL family protein n=1 Tax=unclassified Pseudoalteromonas TaxID=194690 RepID=UPI001F1BD108|nr:MULTISPECIES: YacL family protein [unclassified Pseudoalteromonas]MCF2825618.1 YacL family protein [Pseudoalteromonas sp. OF5H-5]MCF2832186.1 YacL family protein [Pseudoalteromonas sp. DL2-H6]MCF2927639.1 YacL family protein [Pseudoalteromonas sp. DL2-H1]
MEYQFIRDPLSGFRARLNDEHALIGRWLSEELAHERIVSLLTQLENLPNQKEELVLAGKEIRATFTPQEALFESHALFHESDDIAQYQEDALALDESGMMAVCGYEDFLPMLVEWAEFTKAK